MIEERILGTQGVTATFRGMDDTSIEETYIMLYHKYSKDEPILPSVSCLGSVTMDIKEALEKEYNAKLVYLYEYLEPKTEEDKNDEDMFSVDKETFVYTLQPSGCSYPILVKLLRNDTHYFMNICSLSAVELKKFSEVIFKKFHYEPNYKEQVMFGVLYQEGPRVSIRQLPLSDNYVKDMDLGLHYGQPFISQHETILKKMSTNRHGLFIFHGEAGTGKTTYIKYLAKHFGGKRLFIFIPTTHLETLVTPSLLPILLDNSDSVLVLEDSEKAVVSREHALGNESLVSSLLNIGDGILGSMLNLSVVLTFNTKKDKIDSALLRKGRLSYEYEFKPLSVSDSQRLLNSLNKKHKAEKPMTLADIYNVDDETGHKEEQKESIGFKR